MPRDFFSQESCAPRNFFFWEKVCGPWFFSQKSERPVIFGDQKSPCPTVVLTGPVSAKFCSLPKKHFDLTNHQDLNPALLKFEMFPMKKWCMRYLRPAYPCPPSSSPLGRLFPVSAWCFVVGHSFTEISLIVTSLHIDSWCCYCCLCSDSYNVWFKFMVPNPLWGLSPNPHLVPTGGWCTMNLNHTLSFLQDSTFPCRW